MIKIKQGDTFELSNVVTDETTGNVQSIVGWTIKSQVRKSGVLTDDLVFEAIDAPNGSYKLKESASGVTTNWEPGYHDCDIEYTISGTVLSTDTFQIEVIKGITA